ncbi:hypothetical protein HK104_004896 [Borealophlyctis nickersoniae]|nr:hypothetical protein HK104_004896 [Borealophlyctis nickersoniae]
MISLLALLALLSLSLVAAHRPTVNCMADVIMHKRAEQSGGGVSHWGYDGHDGPKVWGKVNEVCEKGSMQSPINLSNTSLLSTTPLSLTYPDYPYPVNFTNNGHTVQVTVPKDAGAYMMIKNERYDLLQFHFHTPSEHRVFDKCE